MKKAFKFIIGAITVSTTTIACIFLFNTKVNAATPTYYNNGHVVIEGEYKNNFNYLYCDSFFETDPNQYNEHIATASMAFVDAATTHIGANKDYSDGAKNIKAVYKHVGLDDWYVADAYNKVPEADSIAFIIGSKDIKLNNKKTIKLITTTIRSASYGMEWASNVKLGTTGEAQGFKEAATKVYDAIEDYTNKYIKDYNGRIAFWIHGFSRGGATANLAAKRLIDKYQQAGNKVYAYCLEAPQGGVASEELKDRDYRGIHNCVNPADLVPYVAPTKFGFKRYGVDHYLTNDQFNSKKLVKSKLFENNLADNEPYLLMDQLTKNAINWQLEKLIPNKDDRKKYAPYEYDRYEISIKKTDIIKVDTDEATATYLKRFMDGLAATTTRKEFAEDGLQQALRNLMIFMNSGANLEKFKEQFGWMDYTLLVGDLLGPALIEGVMEVAQDFWYDMLDTLHIKKREVQQIPLTKMFREKIAAEIIERLQRKEEIEKELDNIYPGKKEQAYKDINNLVVYALGGFTGVDDTVTLVKNLDGILQNHTLTQEFAFLRCQDGWYKTYVYEPMW